MLRFENDYIAGAHPAVLKALVDTNGEYLDNYCTDKYCESARKKIKEYIKCPDADIYFVTGGTQVNQLAISTILKPHQCVVSAYTGHINVHEAGAIEYTGHKVIALPAEHAKLEDGVLLNYLKSFYADSTHDHMPQPGMVYISNPTEYGEVYTKSELSALAKVCKEYNLTLYMDGARLAYALASEKCDYDMSDIASVCDVFYIGGTKCGTLSGEALVFTKNNTPECFVTQIKQHGALLAKGRIVGVQFDALFTDDTYKKIGEHGMACTDVMVKIFEDKKYDFLFKSPSNQQFVIFRNDMMKEIEKNVSFSVWEPVDEDHTAVRFVSSWSTTYEDLDKLRELLPSNE